MRIAPLLTLLLALAPANSPKAEAAPKLADIGYTQRVGARLPLDLVLHDESGRDVRLGDALGGRPTVLIIGYFHCRKLCSVLRAETLDRLVESGLVPGRDYRLVAFSIDPSETSADAMEAKSRDLENFPVGNARENWLYLTGKEDDVAQLTHAVGFDYAYDSERKTFSHPIGRVLLDSEGRVSTYLFGFGLDPVALRAAIKRAAAHGRAPASPVTLFCFDYDPATGNHTLAIMKLLRLLSASSVLILAAFLYGGRRWRRI